MVKKIIGKWQGYNIIFNKNENKYYWTIEDNKNNIQNKFNDPISFSHWIYHAEVKF